MSPDDGKVALRNFLEILANMAKEQTVRKWQIVKKQIEGLIAGTVTPEAYSARMHKEIINNPQPTLVPFTARFLPHLQAALKSGELEIDLVHFTKREKPKKESESNPDGKVGDAEISWPRRRTKNRTNLKSSHLRVLHILKGGLTAGQSCFADCH